MQAGASVSLARRQYLSLPGSDINLTFINEPGVTGTWLNFDMCYRFIWMSVSIIQSRRLNERP
jgi:hypothetical protein